jgi:hypothetical protein
VPLDEFAKSAVADPELFPVPGMDDFQWPTLPDLSLDFVEARKKRDAPDTPLQGGRWPGF